ncbi:MAG TPA: hypothetical protein VJ600_00665 [Holophagaceae bacterium]|nr:hypothetical protein [Holophagaceae bacterium]
MDAGRKSADPEACVALVRRLSGHFGLPPGLLRAEACLQLLRHPVQAEVVLLGPFGAGKRSFLNLMAGKAILPVDALPAEGLSLRFRYGLRERAGVTPPSGEEQELGPGELAWATTGGAGDRVQVTVETPALHALRGLCFLDLPGAWRDPGAEHGRPLRRLVAFPVDHRRDAPSLDRLAGVLSRREGTLLLLTKADLLEEEDRERLVGTLRDELSTRMGSQVSIWPYSTREGFVEARAALRAYLMELAADRYDDHEARVFLEVRALLTGLRGLLGLALAAGRADGEARQDLRRRVQVMRLRMGTHGRELRRLADELRMQCLGAARSQLRPCVPKLTRRLLRRFHLEVAGEGRGVADLPERFRAWLAAALREELEALLSATGHPFDPLLAGAATLGAQAVEAFEARLSAETRKVLGVSFRGAPFQGPPARFPSPAVRVEPMEASGLEPFETLLADGLLQSLRERRFRRQVAKEVERNLAALADRWVASAGVAIEAQVAPALAFMDAELTAVETLIDDAPARVREFETALVDLDAALEGAESW